MADEILRERRGHVEVLTINRPEARNAINRATAIALGDALDDCEKDNDVWVVVLTNSGDKAFSAGMDLKAFAAGEFPITEQGFGGLTKREFTKPLIAAANGSALAGGFEMMISCDLVVAADHAKFGIPEASRGLIAGAGGLIRLAKRIPLAVAYEMALTADPIDADRAYELGLVNRVVPSVEQVLPTALALAERIAKNAPLAVRTSKDIMRQSLELTEEQAWTANDTAFGMIGQTADAMEGAVAFAEKREPNWHGQVGARSVQVVDERGRRGRPDHHDRKRRFREEEADSNGDSRRAVIDDHARLLHESFRHHEGAQQRDRNESVDPLQTRMRQPSSRARSSRKA
jgi:enoyl-CoA hydratase